MNAADDDGWSPIGDLDDLGVGDKKEVSLPNGRLALVMRTEGGVHASCADCPHQDTPLADGMLDGAVLTCLQHFWQWDVTTGKPIGEQTELPLELFELKQEGREWLIRARA